MAIHLIAAIVFVLLLNLGNAANILNPYDFPLLELFEPQGLFESSLSFPPFEGFGALTQNFPGVEVDDEKCIMTFDVSALHLNSTGVHLSITSDERTMTVEYSEAVSNSTDPEQTEDGQHASVMSIETFVIPDQCGPPDSHSKATVSKDGKIFVRLPLHDHKYEFKEVADVDETVIWDNRKNTESSPKESSPKESSPKESSPKESSPKESSPKESSPKESSPKESSPKESSPKASSPKASSPKAASPKESSAKVTIPLVPIEMF